MELQVVIHHDEETGQFWATVPQLPGCFAAGRDREELLESLNEALDLYLDALDPDCPPVEEKVEVENYRLGADRRLQPA